MASDVADGVGPPWPAQEIPNDAFLYYRVHKADHFPEGGIRPGAFRNRKNPDKPGEEAGMSTYWQGHATPEAVKAQAKKPELNTVYRMLAGDVRAIPTQRLQHTPDNRLPENPNRGHSDVFGPKTNSMERLLFLEITRPVE